MPTLTDDGPSRREKDPRKDDERWRRMVYALKAIAAMAATIVALSQLVR